MTIRVLDEKSQLFLFTVVPGLFTSIFGFFMARALRPYNFMSLPFIFVYLKLNCPSVDDFDVKKELRQLLLQDDEENKGKPSNYFQQKWNRIQATIITAIATGTGYQMTIHNCGGAIRFIKTRVPLIHSDFYWIGLCGKWRYLMSTQFDDSDLTKESYKTK